MKRIVTTIVIILLLGAAGYGGYRLYQSRTAANSTAESGTYTQTVTATTGDLSASVTVVGELVAEQSADLAFEEMNGTAPLAELKVAAGSTVAAGDVLATIDPADYRQAVDQAESDYQAAVKTLEDLGEPVTELAVAEADLAIAKAELQVKQAQNDLDDVLNPDLETLQSNLADARDSLAQAQANLLAVQDTGDEEDQLAALRETESEAAAEHGRLAAETYSDVYYQDRLTLAYNKMMNAQDSRVTYELQMQTSLLKAQISVWQAQQNVTKAEKALAEAQAGDPLKEAKARLAVQEAEVSLSTAKDARADLDTGADATDLAAAQADVDKKKLALQNAETALAGTDIIAPFDGTVLQTNASAGDDISAGKVILTLANLNELQVVAAIDETTIKRVAAGQTASVTFDALPGTTLNGGVGEIPLQGTLSGGVMTYDVPIRIQGAEDLPLLVGMTANVVIQTGAVQNALLIPTMALTKSGGMYTVQVPNTLDPAGTPESVPVEVGLSDGSYTQIVRGLVEGDQVLVTLTASDNSSFRGFGGLMGGGMVRRIDR